MKIVIPKQTEVSPGASGRRPSNRSLDAEMYEKAGQLGNQIGQMLDEVEERKRKAKQSVTLADRTSRARVAYAEWFDDRTKDPNQYESLVDDAREFQGELRTTLYEDLDQETQNILGGHLKSFFTNELVKAQHTSTRQSVDVNTATLDKSLDNLILSASRVEDSEELIDIIEFGLAAIDDQGRAGTIPAEEVRKRKANYRTRIYMNQLDQDMLESPQQVLRLLNDKDNYAQLPPHIRTQYIEKARARIKAVSRETQTALAKRVKEAEYALDRGYAPPDLPQLLDAVKGTKLEQDLALTVDGYKQVANFAQMSPRSQAILVGKLKANRKQTGNTVRLIERMEKTMERQKKQRQEDPLQLGVELGHEQSPAPLSFDNQEDFVAGLNARSGMADRLESVFNQEVAPLFSREAEIFAKVLKEGDVTQQQALLAGLYQGLGERTPDALAMVAKKGARQLAYAGGLMGQDTEAARLLLTGIEQRKANKALTPKDKDMSMEDSVLNASNALQEAPAQRADMLEAVRNIYAALSAEAGDFEGVLDGDRLELAVETATGGVIEWDRGPEDSIIFAPRRGVTEDDFEDWVDGLRPSDLEAMGGVAGFEPKRVLELIRDESMLQSVGQGRYLVQVGAGYLTTKSGEPFVLIWPDDYNQVRQEVDSAD